jgi:hypothetical protein
MSSSVAPLFPKTSIFIPAFWEASRGGLLTEEVADARYLRFPVGQGTESIPNLIVSGSSTLGSVSASTFSQSGTYTNTNSGTPAKQVIINNTTPSITITDGTNTTLITPTSVGASNTLQQVLDAGNSATGATTSITLTNSASGGQANPIFFLNNTNATGSVAMEVYKNKPTAGVNGDVLFNQSVYGKDSGNAKQEYTRITHTLRDSASGGEDGSIELSCFVNGAVNTFLQINGVENEINFLKVLDMGGNNIRTTAGNITLDGTFAPSGSGNINLNPRATAVCNVNGNFRIPSTSNNIVIGTTGSGFVGLMSSQGTNYTDNTGNRFSQLTFDGVRLAKGTLFAEQETNIQTYQNIIISDSTNPANNLTTNLTTTGVSFVRTDTGSGNSQNFSFQNDSANGKIEYTNTIGSNGMLIKSNQSVTLESTTGLFFLTNLPTSIGGLPTGALWNNSGVLSVV